MRLSFARRSTPAPRGCVWRLIDLDPETRVWDTRVVFDPAPFSSRTKGGSAALKIKIDFKSWLLSKCLKPTVHNSTYTLSTCTVNVFPSDVVVQHMAAITDLVAEIRMSERTSKSYKLAVETLRLVAKSLVNYTTCSDYRSRSENSGGGPVHTRKNLLAQLPGLLDKRDNSKADACKYQQMLESSRPEDWINAWFSTAVTNPKYFERSAGRSSSQWLLGLLLQNMVPVDETVQVDLILKTFLNRVITDSCRHVPAIGNLRNITDLDLLVRTLHERAGSVVENSLREALFLTTVTQNVLVNNNLSKTGFERAMLVLHEQADATEGLTPLCIGICPGIEELVGFDAAIATIIYEAGSSIIKIIDRSYLSTSTNPVKLQELVNSNLERKKDAQARVDEKETLAVSIEDGDVPAAALCEIRSSYVERHPGFQLRYKQISGADVRGLFEAIARLIKKEKYEDLADLISITNPLIVGRSKIRTFIRHMIEYAVSLDHDKCRIFAQLGMSNISYGHQNIASTSRSGRMLMGRTVADQVEYIPPRRAVVPEEVARVIPSQINYISHTNSVVKARSVRRRLNSELTGVKGECVICYDEGYILTMNVMHHHPQDRICRECRCRLVHANCPICRGPAPPGGWF